MSEAKSAYKSTLDGIGRDALGRQQWFTKPLLYR
jgi:hypothetical protein